MFNNRYPYTDFHELNLDFLLRQYIKLKAEIAKLNKKVKELEEKIEED